MHKNRGQLFVVPGNHDTYWENWYTPNQPAAMLKFIRGVYRDYIYQFKIGSVQFINLGLYASKTKNQKDTRNVTLLETDIPSLEFLQNILQKTDKNMPIVIMFHYPIHSNFSDWWHKEEKNELYEAIKDYNVVAILAGHAHTNKIYSFRGKCPVVMAANASFALLKFDPERPTQVGIKFVNTSGRESTKSVIYNAEEKDFQES